MKIKHLVSGRRYRKIPRDYKRKEARPIL